MAALAGVVAVGCAGCDAAEGMMAIAKTTATGVATQAVGDLVGGAVEGIFGNLVPGAQGG